MVAQNILFSLSIPVKSNSVDYKNIYAVKVKEVHDFNVKQIRPFIFAYFVTLTLLITLFSTENTIYIMRIQENL